MKCIIDSTKLKKHYGKDVFSTLDSEFWYNTENKIFYATNIVKNVYGNEIYNVKSESGKNILMVQYPLIWVLL